MMLDKHLYISVLFRLDLCVCSAVLPWAAAALAWDGCQARTEKSGLSGGVMDTPADSPDDWRVSVQPRTRRTVYTNTRTGVVTWFKPDALKTELERLRDINQEYALSGLLAERAQKAAVRSSGLRQRTRSSLAGLRNAHVVASWWLNRLWQCGRMARCPSTHTSHRTCQRMWWWQQRTRRSQLITSATGMLYRTHTATTRSRHSVPLLGTAQVAPQDGVDTWYRTWKAGVWHHRANQGNRQPRQRRPRRRCTGRGGERQSSEGTAQACHRERGFRTPRGPGENQEGARRG